MFKNKFLLSLLLVGALAMIVFSLRFEEPVIDTIAPPSGKEGTEPAISLQKPDNIDKKLRIAAVVGNSELAELRQASDHYEATRAGVTIDLINMAPAGAYERLLQQAKLQQLPDILMLKNEWVNELAVLGLLMPIDEKFYTSEMQTQQLSQMLSQMKWNGYIWGVPKELDPYIIVVNRKRLNETGTEHMLASIEDLVDLNSVLMDPDADNYGVYIDPNDPLAFISLWWAMGGTLEPLDEEAMNRNAYAELLMTTFLRPDVHSIDREVLREALAEAGIVEEQLPSDGEPAADEEPIAEPGIESFVAVRMNVADQHSGVEDPDRTVATFYPPTGSDWNPWQLLKEGKIAAMITTVSAYKKYGGAELEISSLPMKSHSDFQRNSFLNGMSFAVSTHSSHPEEAFSWIREMTTREQQLRLMDAGGGMPVIVSAYSASSSGSVNRLFREVSKTIEHGGVLPVRPGYGEKIEQFNENLTRLWDGETTVQSFINEAFALWSAVPEK